MALPPVGNAATFLALSIIIGSVVAWVLKDTGVLMYLAPGLVLDLSQPWELLTWIPLRKGAGAVLFGALIVWSTGGSLEMLWGRKRFVAFALLVPFLAGLATVALAVVLPPLRFIPFEGGSVMASCVWVGYGCAIWSRQTNIFGYPVTGRTFAMLGVLITSMEAVFSSVYLLVPEFLGLAFTFAYARFNWPENLLLRFGSWRVRRALDKRSAHLTVVSNDRNMPKDSDRYLH